MEVFLGVRSRKQPEVNHMKSGEDYSRFFGGIYTVKGAMRLGAPIEDSGFLSMSNETC